MDQSCKLWLIHLSLLGKNLESWAKGLRQEDFELLCLDGTRKPVTEAQSCHLARVPNHAVFSRKDKVYFTRRILFNQQVWVPVPTPHDSVPVPRTALVPVNPYPAQLILFLPEKRALGLLGLSGYI